MITQRKGIINPNDKTNILTFGNNENLSNIIALMNDYDKMMLDNLVVLNRIFGKDYINLDQYEDIVRFIQRINAENEYDYLNTLLHPEYCKAVKIPSPIPVPSCAFQLHNTVTLTTNALGNLCFLFNPFFLYDKSILNNYVFPTQTLAGVENSAFNFCTSFFLNNSPEVDGFTPNAGNWTAINIGQGIPNVYNQYRLVSASLVVRYIGRMDITSGVIGGAIIYDESIYPGGLMNYNNAGQNYTFSNRSPGLWKYTNFDLAMDSYYHQERNCIQGLREIYFPLDNTYEEYQKMLTASDVKQMNQQVVSSSGETIGLPAVSTLYDTKKGFQQMVYILGAPPESACFKIDVYCNFETLPNAEFLNYMPVSLTQNSISPEFKKQSIAYVQKEPITGLNEKKNLIGKVGKGILTGLKNIFKKGVPRTLLEQLPLPLYKTATTVYDLFNTYTFNKDDSFRNQNQTPQDVIMNAEIMDNGGNY